MRRLPLSSPRALPADVGDAVGSGTAASGEVVGSPAELLPRRLRRPAPARNEPRRFFDPVSGWFRRLEHRTSLWLSRHLYPRLPGIATPYGAILDRNLIAAEADIPVRGLAGGLDGVRILLASDIHAGPFLDPAALARAFSRAATLEPDVILLAGDFATGRLDDLTNHERVFATLSAPLGVFGVLGNHDHYTREAGTLSRRLAGCGIRVLHNRSVTLERDGARIVLAGVDDLNAGRPDLDAALDEARSIDASAPTVLLSHNPDVFFAAASRGVRLVLAGHTHGGQVRVPGWPVLVRMSRYRLDEGRYVWNGSELLVTRGLGVTGIPLRVWCPPEVVLVTLRRAPAA